MPHPRFDWADAFQHEALLYHDLDEFLAGTVPFVRDGVAAAEPVLVALPEPRRSALRGELAGDANHVAFADMEKLSRNPARLIPAWQDFLAANGGGERPLRGVGEPIWAGRRVDEVVECQRHESLLNVAFAESGAWRLLCPYDVRSLGPRVVEEARHSHPWVTADGRRDNSPLCEELSVMSEPLDSPLPPPPRSAKSLGFARGDVGAVRGFVARVARDAHFNRHRVDDLVLAAYEIASNAVRHGGGRGMARAWESDGAVICEVAGDGRITDPLAGRRRPDPAAHGGRGLWLANQLCDLVQVRAFPSGGVVRIHVRP